MVDAWLAMGMGLSVPVVRCGPAVGRGGAAPLSAMFSICPQKHNGFLMHDISIIIDVTIEERNIRVNVALSL